jgi:hypothetical protein
MQADLPIANGHCLSRPHPLLMIMPLARMATVILPSTFLVRNNTLIWVSAYSPPDALHAHRSMLYGVACSLAGMSFALDLIKAETPYTTAKISRMLEQLEFKLQVEHQYKKAILQMAKLYQADGDKKSRADADAKRVESDKKIQLLQVALKRYRNLHIIDDPLDDGTSKRKSIPVFQVVCFMPLALYLGFLFLLFLTTHMHGNGKAF